MRADIATHSGAGKPRAHRSAVKGCWHVPKYFWYGCLKARAGGRNCYDDPGWHLGIHLSEILTYEYGSEKADQKISKLYDAINAEDDATALRWLKHEMPGCYKIIPSRRRQQVLRGIIIADDEGRL